MLLQGAAVLRDGQPIITLPDGSELVGTGEKTDDALSAWLGRPVRLAAAIDEAAGYQMNVSAEDHRVTKRELVRRFLPILRRAADQLAHAL